MTRVNFSTPTLSKGAPPRNRGTESFAKASLWATIGAAVALSLGVLAAVGRTAPPPAAPQVAPAPPANGAPPLVYAVLTKSGSGLGENSAASYSWEFTDGVHVTAGKPLETMLNIRTGARFDSATMVNAIANLGWDLVSQSERSSSTSADVMNGNSVGSGQSHVVEHWWFKHR